MSKFIGADRHVPEVIKSGFHYGQLVRDEPRVEPTMDDPPPPPPHPFGSDSNVFDTKNVSENNSVCSRRTAVHRAERECGRRSARQSSVCGDIRPTLTYHASTDDVDESRGCTLRSRVRCKVAT